MWQRCTNQNNQKFAYYGGRRIAVCKRWERFENFLADMRPKPSPKYSIERIDNDGNYAPANCRWATPREQRVNQRRRSRETFAWGEAVASAKLTECEAQAIRGMHATGSYLQRDLARRYGVSCTTISNIVTQRTWSHLREAS